MRSLGQCTQYVSPGGNNPFEMIELSAPARNGDSGGPILNDRGEIAGVLFGSAYGQTTGSYCGRLRYFLSSAADDLQRLPAQPAAIAQQQSTPLVPARRYCRATFFIRVRIKQCTGFRLEGEYSIFKCKYQKTMPVSTAISAKLPAASYPY